MFDLLTKDEPLHPDLHNYVVQGPLGKALKHPLVFCIIGFNPKKAALLNYQYEQKKLYLEEAIKEKKWSTVIMLHEKPHRLEAFNQHKDQMSDDEYWYNLSSVIIGSENLWQYDTLLRIVLTDPKRSVTRHLLMTEDERQILAKMPDSLQIWRGCRWQNRFGLSWTLDRDTAVWFAKRLGTKKPRLHSGVVQKKDVIAYFGGRNEKEILVIHTKISDRKLELL